MNNQDLSSHRNGVFLSRLHMFNVCFLTHACIKSKIILTACDILAICEDVFMTK